MSDPRTNAGRALLNDLSRRGWGRESYDLAAMQVAAIEAEAVAADRARLRAEVAGDVVWVVMYRQWHGDDEIDAIFPTRELAFEFCRRYGVKEAMIEEHRVWNVIPVAGPNGEWVDGQTDNDEAVGR